MTSVVVTFAQESKGSPPIIQPSTNTDALVPEKYKGDKFVQLLLSAYEFQKNRADQGDKDKVELKSQVSEMRTSRDEWKNLFLDERKAAVKLQFSLDESRNETVAVAKQRDSALSQVDTERLLSKEKDRRISNLKRSRLQWAGISFVFGNVTGYVARGQIQNRQF